MIFHSDSPFNKAPHFFVVVAEMNHKTCFVCMCEWTKKAYKIHAIYLIPMKAIQCVSGTILFHVHCSNWCWFMTALNWMGQPAHKFCIFMKKFETRQLNVIYEEIVWTPWWKPQWHSIELPCRADSITMIVAKVAVTIKWQSCRRFWFNLWRVHDVTSKVCSRTSNARGRCANGVARFEGAGLLFL